MTMTPTEIEQEGREAFKRGEGASGCPYSFGRSQFWARKDYVGFETVRWKLNAWMDGWIAEQKLAAPAARNLRRGRK